MRGLILLLKGIYSVYAFIIFLVIMLLLFPFSILANFLERIKGGNLMMRLCML